MKRLIQVVIAGVVTFTVFLGLALCILVLKAQEASVGSSMSSSAEANS